MFRFPIICIAFCLVATAVAKPVELDDETEAEQGPYFEGDMVEPYEGAFSGLINTRFRWPSNTIVYKWDPELSSTAKSRTEQAIVRVTQETGGCIKFRQATSSDEDRFVLIRAGSGCSATVGYYGRTTYVSLSTRCSVGNIMHEFQHTLGIYHQQSRPDRDSFVRIATENITPGREGNFRKQSTSSASSYGTPYDFGSQMHYSVRAFTKNGEDTIVPLPGKVPDGVRIGQRDRMSDYDVALVKAMYGC